MIGSKPNGVNGANGHDTTNGPDSVNSQQVPADTLAVVLENLTSSVRSALSYMEGPLKNTLEAKLHDQGEHKLPDAKLSSLAAEVVNELHKAQLMLEPKPVILADHFLGYVSSKCLNAAVEQNIPDILEKSGPLTLEQLSEISESRPARLSQILTLLRNNGIFAYDPATGRYSNNAASTLLLSNHWTQWKNWVELYGNQMYDIARGIPESTKKSSNRSAAQVNYDTDLDMFSYFQERGWVPILHRTLSGGAEAMAPGIVEDYPWESLLGANGKGGKVLDIGGGGGGLIVSLLRRFPDLQGAVFDLPKVIERNKTLFHDKEGLYSDVGDRVELFGGDFFKEVPAFENYTMKWCLHDWTDDNSVAILSTVRKAIIPGPKSRLVVMETVLADGRAQRLSRYADIHMMMMTAGGRERTEEQWRAIAERAGWKVEKLYHLRGAWVKAIELSPAESKEKYVMGHDNTELKRLTAQHEWIKASTGSLLHCPVNMKKEGMRILDSGTADGVWMMDLATSLPESTKFFGTDIAPHMFPANPPKNMEFSVQSVTDPWPKEWESSFDLVHQKLVLAACDPASAKKVVATLFSLVKPGGWIQLLECDHSGGFSAEKKARSPATAKFGDLVINAMAKSGKSGQHGLGLRGYLREAGAVNVVETLLDCPVGVSAASPSLRESTKENLLQVVTNLKAASTSETALPQTLA